MLHCKPIVDHSRHHQRAHRPTQAQYDTLWRLFHIDPNGAMSYSEFTTRFTLTNTTFFGQWCGRTALIRSNGTTNV